MTKLRELLAQLDVLNAEIESTRTRERDEELPRLIGLVADYHITEVDLFGKQVNKRDPKHRDDVAPRIQQSGNVGKGVAKYRDPDSEKTWSGLGRTPSWFDPAQAEKYTIKD